MSLEYLKLIGFNIKEYFVDIALLISIGLFTNLIIFVISHLFPKIPFLPNDYDLFPLPMPLIQISIWILFFLILRWVMGKRVATFLSGIFSNKYSFTMDDNLNRLTENRLMKEWILQGNIFVKDGGLLISNSNSGCLIRPRWYIFSRIWKNFTATMKIEFTPQVNLINPRDDKHPHQNIQEACDNSCQNEFKKILGIVFRAQNFDDYFMLEVCYINKHIVIRPHIRASGNWDAPELNPDFDSYPLSLTQTSSIDLELVVKKNKATLYINGNRTKPVIWLLPDFVEPRLIQHTSGDPKNGSKTAISEIYFKNMAGMFGFRNYPNELTLIKSLDIR